MHSDIQQTSLSVNIRCLHNNYDKMHARTKDKSIIILIIILEFHNYYEIPKWTLLPDNFVGSANSLVRLTRNGYTAPAVQKFSLVY